MLPPNRRLRSAGDIGAVVRRGRKAGSSRIVVHALERQTSEPARFGLAVGKSVGGSVVRHRVARRLRAQLALQVDQWDARGVDIVVRALPRAADASSEQLRSDLMRCGAKLDADSLAGRSRW